MNFIKGISKFAILSVLVAVISTTFVSDLMAQADKPLVPRLTLIGDDGSWDTDFYPDGRIWLPTAGEEVPREFLLPVFMNNNWYNYWKDDTLRKKYIPNDITSFKFSILYDGETLQAEGVEVVPPEYMLDMVSADEILARNFNFITDDVEDDNYWKQIDENSWNANKDQREAGRRFTIDATSAFRLPNSDNAEMGRINYNILLFVRFSVKAKIKTGQDAEFISKKPLYIDNREIMYNDMNAAKDRAVVEMFDYPVEQSLTDYPGPDPLILTGVDNSETPVFNSEPYRVGSIAVHFFDKFPEFELVSNELDNDIVAMQDENGDEIIGAYRLTKPITVDSNANATANIQVKVANKVTGTRLTNPMMMSNAEWLQFRADPDLSPSAYPKRWTTMSRSDLRYLDNGILGNGRVDPMNGNTVAQEPYYLLLEAKTDILDESGEQYGEERTGYYEAWMTFKAPFAEVNPIRLEVPFLYIKNPDERPIGSVDHTGGITLSLYNADPKQEHLDIVFGTGVRASKFAESLYGESIYATPMNDNKFDARWFPDENDADIQSQQPALIENGYRDVAPNRYNPRTNSRDIRFADPEVTTYTYHCKFKSGGADKYPVVLEWDTNEFPENALVYLRDAENGKYFPALNMREGNPLGGTKFSYTFTDARIEEFYIEYSLPNAFEFIDDEGNPVIQTGWNMVSMPVLPLNTNYTEVYPNMINIPYQFTLNQYDPIVTPELNFGQGYFIKYSDVVDKLFIGAKISTVPAPGGEKVKVYPADVKDVHPDLQDDMGGWNLVGSISYPTGLGNVTFDAWEVGQTPPDADFTFRHGFWRYVPKKGYQEVNVLNPGYGYWIKTNQSGFYNLEFDPLTPKVTNTASVIADNSEITIRDNAQNEGNLYISTDLNMNVAACELPPCPPAEVFDVRFDGNKYLTNADESIINLQGVEYPVNIYIANSPAEYSFTDAENGKLFGTISKGFTGNITINKAVANTVKMAKVASETGIDPEFEVYPNPANAVSTVNFNVSVDSYVTVKVYNSLGNEVMTLTEGQFNAGNYSESLDVTNLTSGNYIVRIAYGNTSEVVKVTVVK